ncbi:uncharacterized protein LOC133914786 [Phragmites australis]|uniref:uncharacterized protein LOC133914786 n=1 Tax=Phragmites australis TaxID=29695 RepID=UPI002D77A977|nr:uncharacterized protein LOC133914786 [Phragmites australis]
MSDTTSANDITSIPAAVAPTLPAMGTPSSPALALSGIPATGGPVLPAMAMPSSHTLATSSTTVAALSSAAQALSAVNIKALVPYTLDLQANNYKKWSVLFTIVLGKHGLHHHVDLGEGEEHDLDNEEWTLADFTVLMWIYSTISEELLYTVMAPESTAYGAWLRLEQLFLENKRARAIHLEADFRSLVQGDLSVTAYCHRLKELSDALADVDQPVTNETLVLQMIRGLNPKFSTIGTILPTQQPFPTFIQARSLLLLEETAQANAARNAAASTLVAAARR